MVIGIKGIMSCYLSIMFIWSLRRPCDDNLAVFYQYFIDTLSTKCYETVYVGKRVEIKGVALI